MGDLFSTMLRNIKKQAVTEYWCMLMKLPIRIHWQLLAFYGEDTVNIKTTC
jgi:hypothetical protein